jgi:anti-anti-sigma factor
MSLDIHLHDDTLQCSGVLDISTAPDLGKAVAENLRQHPQTILDLAAVTDCDAAGLQVLYAAKRQAEVYAKRFAISATSPGIAHRAIILGISLDELFLETASV